MSFSPGREGAEEDRDGRADAEKENADGSGFANVSEVSQKAPAEDREEERILLLVIIFVWVKEMLGGGESGEVWIFFLEEFKPRCC